MHYDIWKGELIVSTEMYLTRSVIITIETPSALYVSDKKSSCLYNY